jgi:flagellar basal-body rod protein FlgB
MANMVDKLVFDRAGIPRLQRLVDLAAFRHKLLASNIANATSPNYQRRDVDFQGELSRAMETRRVKPQTTRPEHIVSERAAGAPKVQRLTGGTNAPELSGVDIDKEMGELATNALDYEVGTRLISKTFSGLRTAIRGRS